MVGGGVYDLTVVPVTSIALVTPRILKVTIMANLMTPPHQ